MRACEITTDDIDWAASVIQHTFELKISKTKQNIISVILLDDLKVRVYVCLSLVE